ncbi:MAG TPA: hypothetical protein VFI22_00280, partial [Thermomicrobiales bacterium]|nr:hypothetical protein [Thermomicrobiales bacterium]
ALEARGWASPHPADAGVAPAALLLWHFANTRRRPDDVEADSSAGWRAIDEFAGSGHSEFVRALLREYVYQQSIRHDEAE